MYLWHVFLVKPLAALSIIVCLGTIFACFQLRRQRPQQKSDKFLIGFLGLLAIYQGFRILESVGILPVSINSSLDDGIELLVTTFYLVAALLLRFSTINHLDAESAFRLARAAPPRLSPDTTARDLPVPKAPAAFNALDALTWALPRLSDGAFKLYVYLCVTADPAGKAEVQDREIQLRMKRSAGELDSNWKELERAGAATVRREDGHIEVEIGNQRILAADAPQYAAR